MSSIWKLLYIVAIVIVAAYIAVLVPIILINIDAYNYGKSAVENIVGNVLETSVIVNGSRYIRAEFSMGTLYGEGVVLMGYGIIFLVDRISRSLKMWKMLRQNMLDYSESTMVYGVIFIISCICSLLCIGGGDTLRYETINPPSAKYIELLINILVPLALIEIATGFLLTYRKPLEEAWKRKQGKIL